MAKSISKTFRCRESTSVKLDQLVAHANENNEKYGIDKTNTSAIIEDAINFYYSSKIGKEVISDSVTQLQDIVSNATNLVMRSYAEQIAQALNHVQLYSAMIKRLVVTLIRSADVLPDDPESMDRAITASKNLQYEIETLMKNEIVNGGDYHE